MPRESKPLFRPEALRPRVQEYSLPPSVQTHCEVIEKWAILLAPDAKRKFGEQEILADFVDDIFCKLLGYTRPADGPDRFTRAREKYVEYSGKFADAVLGEFRSDEKDRPLIAVEGKGPKDPLDRPFAGRKKSAVDQGYGYAINLPCDWIVVTSMRQTRLYHKGSDQLTYESFDIASLLENDSVLKRFVFLLHADNVVPDDGACHLYALKQASDKIGKRLTDKFYVDYSEIRDEIFESISTTNPTHPQLEVLAASQKLLDRVLFTAFCEDRGLLPDETLKHAFEHSDPYNPRPIWSNFRGLFRSIDTGNPDLDIPPYNGGLFAEDQFLESLSIPDSVCENFKELGEYEYSLETAVEAEGDALNTEVIDVEILGHIFEQSITDLERLRNEIEGLAPPEGRDKHRTRRKKDGAFYTPQYITRYIVANTLHPTLAVRFEELRREHEARASGTSAKSLREPDVYDIDRLNSKQRAALVEFWEAWQDKLSHFRILDPACGSGAFLIEAFDQLHAVYDASNERLKELRGYASLFDLDRSILQNNLFGVDINNEAVQICRLSLWIKTAARGKALTSLDDTVRVGNSIVSSPDAHALAFDWNASFPDVSKDGGFDIVVGNPPYIRQEWLKPYKDAFSSEFNSYSGTADAFIYFFERSLSVLKPGGLLGFITSGTFVTTASASQFRKWFAGCASFESIVNFGENQPFRDAEMVYPTISIVRKGRQETDFPHLFVREKIPNHLEEALANDGVSCDRRVFDSKEWKMQPHAITELFNSLMLEGTSLKEHSQGRMYSGVLTGANDIFIVDAETKDRLCQEHESSAEVFRKMLRGEDLRPWYFEDEDRWMIFTRRGIDIKKYPAIRAYLEPFRRQLEPRPDDWPAGKPWEGRRPGSYQWYEIRDPIDYFEEFESPKIIWPDIAKLPRFSWDDQATYMNDKAFLVAGSSPSLLAVLQSRVSWFLVSQMCTALRLRGGLWQYQCKKQFVERLRVPEMESSTERRLSDLAMQATEIARNRYLLHEEVRHRITSDLCAGKPMSDRSRLFSWWEIDFATMRSEVKRASGSDIVVQERSQWESALQAWGERDSQLAGVLSAAEEEINLLVEEAFGLSAERKALLQEHTDRAMINYSYATP